MIINIKKSNTAALVFLLVHSGALVLLGILPLPVGVRALAGLALALDLYFLLGLHAYRFHRRAVVALRLGAAGACAVRTRGRRDWCRGEIVSHTLWPGAVFLVIRQPGRRIGKSVVIPADAVDAEHFRCLRAQLVGAQA